MNVHILSDTPRGTGAYSKLTRNLAQGLAEHGHSITVTGFLNGYENFQGINILPLQTPYAPPQVQFADNLRSSKAECLICIHEAHGDANIYSQMFSPAYFWVPVEGEGIPQHMSSSLRSPNLACVVPMSIAGKKELANEGIESTVIYPGYDPAVFKKMDMKHPEKQCIYSMDIYQHTQDPGKLCERGCFRCEGEGAPAHGAEGCPYYENERVTLNIAGNEFTGPLHAMNMVRDNMGAEYVIGCVAANVGLRKRLERLIEAFSKTEAAKKKEALLHVHTLPVSSRAVVDLFDTARKFNVLDRVVFSYSSNAVYGISDHGLNMLYNYFDIHATASSYEGFGMTVLESESTGKAQTAPHCATFPELLGENEERGLLASIATTSVEADGVTRYLVDTGSLAEKMDILCSDKIFRNRLGAAGEEWAKQFTWDNIVKLWDSLLRDSEVSASASAQKTSAEPESVRIIKNFQGGK